MIPQTLQNSIVIKRRRPYINLFGKLITVLLYGFLFFHFTVVALLLLPDNPLRHSYKMQIGDYVSPFFEQSWNLFAPNPSDTNTNIIFEFTIYQKENVQFYPPVNITEPIIADKKKFFWSQSQRLSNFLFNSTSDIHAIDDKIRVYISKADSLKNDSLTALRYRDREFPELSIGHNNLLNYSRYVIKDLKINPGDYDSILIRYRIIDYTFPRFSKRKESFFDTINNYSISEKRSRNYRIY